MCNISVCLSVCLSLSFTEIYHIAHTHIPTYHILTLTLTPNPYSLNLPLSHSLTLSFSATTIHNKARGYAEWPGIVGYFLVGGEAVEVEKIKIITTHVLGGAEGDSTVSSKAEGSDSTDGSATAVGTNGRDSTDSSIADSSGGTDSSATGDRDRDGDRGRDVVLLKSHDVRNYPKKMDLLRVVCGDGSVLGISELQPPSKKVMGVRDFMNGLRGDTAIKWASIPASTSVPAPVPTSASVPTEASAHASGA
jgi:hypothetical protein